MRTPIINNEIKNFSKKDKITNNEELNNLCDNKGKSDEKNNEILNPLDKNNNKIIINHSDKKEIIKTTNEINDIKVKNNEKNKTNNNGNTNNSNTTNKSSKNNTSLPNITTNSHYGGNSEDNKIVNSESSNKMLSKYKLVTNGSNSNDNKIAKKNDSIKNNCFIENKKIIIKTENTLSSLNNISNPKKSSHKESNRSIESELVNNMPTHRLYQPKKGVIKKDKDFLKYLEGLGGGLLYSKYAQQIEGNKYNSKNRVNLYYKSTNKNHQYLPNIYKTKSNNSVNKYGISRRK
jgi:hypothetical protein